MAPAEAPPEISLADPALYVNRELSLLEFQRRVLEEAQDENNPLLERVKFLAIFGSNMDEFFMVRVSGIRKLVEARIRAVSPDGLAPRDELAAIDPARNGHQQKCDQRGRGTHARNLPRSSIEMLDTTGTKFLCLRQQKSPGAKPGLSSFQGGENTQYLATTGPPKR